MINRNRDSSENIAGRRGKCHLEELASCLRGVVWKIAQQRNDALCCTLDLGREGFIMRLLKRSG